MSAEANKAVVRRFTEEVVNQRNPALMDELIAPDVVYHSMPPGMPAGIEGYRAMMSMFMTAFPDLQLTIDDQVAEGDRVVTRMTGRGTHQGEMMGIPPTGMRVEAGSISVMRFANGKIAEEWEQIDMLGMMQQLGVVPAPEHVSA